MEANLLAGLIERLKGLFARKQPTETVPELMEKLRAAYLKNRGMQAKVDAAQTTDDNKRHWAGIGNFDADSEFNPAVRFTLRNRARYEVLNNSYAKGDVRSSADDLIGTGPRLQLTLTSVNGQDLGEVAKTIERNFGKWCDATQLAMNFRTAEKSHVRDGECFGIFDTDERLDNPVKFNIRWTEADLCQSPFFSAPGDPDVIDGIRFDRFGRPLEYFFLKHHPGSVQASAVDPMAYYTVPAEQVLHWFRPDRFGQHRGIPEMTPSLPIYAQLRRWTLATLTAAEFAATIAGIMKSRLPLDSNSQVGQVPDFDLIEMHRGTLLTLPEGYDATQMDAKQPTATYGDFKRELLNESGRATGKPLNVVSGNSSGYNYSSGRLDIVPYVRSMRIVRNDMKLVLLDRILKGWYAEAVLVGEVPPEAPAIAEWKWSWNWDGYQSIDERKDAAADDIRLKNGTTTYAELFGEYGQDWTEQLDQIAREKAYCAKRGLPWPVLSMPVEYVATQDNTTTPPGEGSSPNAPPPDDKGTPQAPPSNLSRSRAELIAAAHVHRAMDESGFDGDELAELMESLPERNGKAH